MRWAGTFTRALAQTQRLALLLGAALLRSSLLAVQGVGVAVRRPLLEATRRRRKRSLIYFLSPMKMRVRKERRGGLVLLELVPGVPPAALWVLMALALPLWRRVSLLSWALCVTRLVTLS